MNIIISHRGNLNGPNSSTENKPSTISEVLKKGFEVEIDLWVIHGKLFLGHDNPVYPIDYQFLTNPGLWIHCKNKKALDFMSKTDLNYFWHTKEDYVFTSKGYILTHTGLKPLKQSICMLPENLENFFRDCKGICTDFPIRFKDLLTKKKEYVFI